MTTTKRIKLVDNTLHITHFTAGRHITADIFRIATITDPNNDDYRLVSHFIQFIYKCRRHPMRNRLPIVSRYYYYTLFTHLLLQHSAVVVIVVGLSCLLKTTVVHQLSNRLTDNSTKQQKTNRSTVALLLLLFDYFQMNQFDQAPKRSKKKLMRRQLTHRKKNIQKLYHITFCL